MRKLAAILLLCLYTFNLVGYHVVFHLLENKAAQTLQTSLDRDAYNDADLVSLTTPLHLPYISDTRSFERADGEITKDGKIYHFVKRAIRNGALVLLCLPDHQKMQLERTKGEFSKQAADDQASGSSEKRSDKKDDLAKSFRTKYRQPLALETVVFPTGLTADLSGFNSPSLESQPTCFWGPPPELREPFFFPSHIFRPEGLRNRIVHTTPH